MSIPKVIHYCWFGGKELSPLAKKCMKSWKKYCPDYQIIRWDETNFDVSRHSFMQEAYDAKKWAFVSDIARLLIIYENGGIYLDTDVELVKPLDSLLDYKAFFGFERLVISTGNGFGAEPKNSIVKAMLEAYSGEEYQNKSDNKGTVCSVYNTAALVKLGLKADGTDQLIDGARFLPEEYLSPIDWLDRTRTNFTENTISIHHYAASWKRLDKRIKYKLRRFVGTSAVNRIKGLLAKLR